jgi:hypothetical protein
MHRSKREPDTMETGRTSSQWSTLEKGALSPVSSPKEALKEFARGESSGRSSFESKTDTNESVWPSLPPLPKFDLFDELSAKEREADGLRRLDQEQRGTLWNA